MILKQLLTLIALLFLLSCNEVKKTDDYNNSKVDTNVLKQEHSNASYLSTDSTKLFRAFDDIYFGTLNPSEKYDQKIYSINKIQLGFNRPKSSREYGLYAFTLISIDKNYFKEMPEELNDIKKTIETSYSNGQKIQETFKDDYADNVRKFEIHYSPGFIKMPDDNCTETFIYKFTKDETLIKLGYIIEYDPKYNINYNNTPVDSSKIIGYEKMFKIKVSFSFLEAEKKVKNEEDSISKIKATENKQKDALKF